MKEYMKRDLNRTYLILENDREDYEESYEIEMLVKNQPPAFLPVKVIRIDRNIQLYYDVSSRQSLFASCEYQKISCRMLKKLLIQLQELVNETKEYLLDQNCLCLDMEHIYVKEEQFGFLYCPWETADVAKAFRKLLEEILGKLDYQDREGVELAYSLYQSVCKGEYNITELLKIRVEPQKEIPPESALFYEEDFADSYNLKDDLWESEKETPKESEVPEKSEKKTGIFGKIVHFFMKREEEEEIRDFYPDPWTELDKIRIPEESYGFSSCVAEDSGMYGSTAQSMGTVTLSKYTTDDFTGSAAKPKAENVVWRLRPLLPAYEEFMIREGSFLIGKKKEVVDGVIDKGTISRIHSRLLLNEGRLFVGDANSTNGTYVNGKQIPPGIDVEIFAGDRVLFADVGYECYNSL